MAVFGHTEVFVEKREETRSWLVYTSRHPRQLLCEVYWRDAFRDLNRAQYPDYLEALATCQSSSVTRLTRDEERIAQAEARGEVILTEKAPLEQPESPSDFSDVNGRVLPFARPRRRPS